MRNFIYLSLVTSALAAAGCKQNSSSGVASSTPTASSAQAAASLTSVTANIQNWETIAVHGQLPNKSDYHTQLFPTADVATVLNPKPQDTGIPAAMWGIWWTDGDTLPIKALSFYNSNWDAANKRIILPVYANESYTYVGDNSGSNFWSLMFDLHLLYEVTFQIDGSGKLTAGTIVPCMFLGGRYVKIPSWIANFTMEPGADEGIWIRHSSFFGTKAPDYMFTRVVMPDGSPDHGHNDGYARYVSTSLPNSYIIKHN